MNGLEFPGGVLLFIAFFWHVPRHEYPSFGETYLLFRCRLGIKHMYSTYLMTVPILSELATIWNVGLVITG